MRVPIWIAFGCALPVASQPARSEQQIIVTAPGLASETPAPAVTGVDLALGGTPDLLGGLARNLAGVSLSDAQNNPFQPNLVYHGYSISPLQGSAQGLAVYLDGGRFNQPFGDTVDFDLLPEAAIDRITIEATNPVYGLNALGGAMVVATKTGRTAPGLTLWGAGGSYRWAEGGAEAGWSRGAWSAYAAVQESHDGGWRRHSPSRLYNGYADLGYDGPGAGAHVKLVGADSDLTGNGSAPVELLAANRRAVFTWPDNTRNRFGRVSVHPWVALSERTRIEASAYLQQLRQRTANGDNADIEACDDDDAAGLLCLESADDDDDSMLRDRSGAPIVDLLGDDGAYGVFNRSRTRTTAGGALVQLVDRRPLLGGDNLLRLGVSHDRSRTHFRSETELGVLTEERGVAGLGPVIDQPDGSIAPVSLTARTRYTGLFAADTLPLGERLSLDLGLRFNIARVLLDDRIGTALDGRHRFTRLNPGAALAYRVSPALTVRAGYAETNRAPTPAELSCAGPDDPCSLTNFFVGDPPLKQVVARTWSAAGSGEIQAHGWALRWQLSAWRASNHDDIQFVAADVRGRAYFQNVGETRRQGADLGVSATRGGLTLRAGYAFTDATFRSPLILHSPDNPEADGDGRIAVVPGNRMPGVPRHRATLSADYETGRVTLGGDVQAQSGQYLFGDEANLQPRTRAFAVINLRGSVRVAGPIALFGEVTNLLDRRYASFGTFSETGEVYLSEAPHAEDPRSLGPGSPRRWKAGLRAHF
ncbi:TonB-dependent receptor [Sphingomonas quercus]|uniref:TonB-dependent receptor n=1 Tax=Sphingomonas quercus TaxID=2842451 RepID=A0ABS6BGP6_9SPHN|nr:TonB-dependent receptor [Sphingomonas quercus]MBU3077359.1 TonB-dependent receptor [Sphingomonas quercus]